MRSTGLVLAAGGIAIANEAIFAPLASAQSANASTTGMLLLKGGVDINWRLIPATAILALTLGGLEKLSEPFAVGLAGLTLLAVLIIPVGKAPSPIDNIAKTIGVA